MAFVLRRPGDPSFEIALGDKPVSLGTDRESDVRLAGEGLAGCHVLVSRSSIEARADITVGGVRLRAGRSRACVPSVLRVGETTFTIDSAAESSVATRELVFRHLSGEAALTPRIVVVEGPSRGRELVLRGDGTYTVGRGADCDLAVEDRQISRVHFEVALADGSVFVCDRGSTSGVALGGSVLEPRRKASWPAHRMVKAGASVFAFVGPPASMEQPAAEPGEPSEVDETSSSTPAEQPALSRRGAPPVALVENEEVGQAPAVRPPLPHPVALRLAFAVFVVVAVFAVGAIAYVLFF